MSVYRTSNARSLTNGFYGNSARNSYDYANLSSYTRHSNSDCALPMICQPTSIADTSPSCNHRFARLTEGERLYPPESVTHPIHHRGVQIFIAELLGSAILMFAGCAWLSVYQVWTFAISAMAAVHTFGPISGAHINPGATIVAFIVGQVPQKSLVLIYWMAQFLGAFLGYLLHYEVTIFDKDEKTMCLTKPPHNGAVGKTFGLELVMSMIFFLAIAALFDPKNKFSKDTACLKVGFILYGLLNSTLGVIPLSMNTARSLPPAILLSDFDGHWIYWIAPNLAAVLAGGMYRFIFGNRPVPNSEEVKNLS